MTHIFQAQTTRPGPISLRRVLHRCQPSLWWHRGWWWGSASPEILGFWHRGKLPSQRPAPWRPGWKTTIDWLPLKNGCFWFVLVRDFGILQSYNTVASDLIMGVQMRREKTWWLVDKMHPSYPHCWWNLHEHNSSINLGKRPGRGNRMRGISSTKGWDCFWRLRDLLNMVARPCSKQWIASFGKIVPDSKPKEI